MVDRFFSGRGTFGFSWSQFGDGECIKVEFKVTRQQLVHAKLPHFDYHWLVALKPGRRTKLILSIEW